MGCSSMGLFFPQLLLVLLGCSMRVSPWGMLPCGFPERFVVCALAFGVILWYGFEVESG